MAEQHLFVIDVMAALADWRVLLNGRTVSRGKATTGERKSVVVNPSIRSGENTVALQVRHREEADGTIVTVAPPIAFEVTVREGLRGQVPGPEGLRANWRLSEPLRIPVSSGWSTAWSGAFSASVPWLTAWQKAAPRPADAGYEQLLSTYEQALSKRDASTIEKLRALQLADIKAALTLDDEDVTVPLRQSLAEHFTDPKWRVRRTTPVLFVTEGDGRVVRATDGDGDPALWAMTRDGEIPFDFCCAYINGQWSIVE